MNFEIYATSDETICSSDCKDMKTFSMRDQKFQILEKRNEKLIKMFYILSTKFIDILRKTKYIIFYNISKESRAFADRFEISILKKSKRK